MSGSPLTLDERRGVLRAGLARPEARNAIDRPLVDALMRAVDRAEASPDVRVLVLHGGPDVFCSGLDLDAQLDRARPASEVRADVEAYFDLLTRLSTSACVVVAEVEGAAIAGGVGLVAASDFVFAGPKATFALTELLFGLLPAVVLPFIVPRIGAHRARLLALSTRAIDAAEAHRWGLVDRLAPDPKAHVAAEARRWTRLKPAAIRRLRAYLGAMRPDLASQRDPAVDALCALLDEPAVSGPLRAYLDGGPPPWS